MDYEVKLDIFEGPLDLLLYLIKKNEIDIYDIPIALITEQYLQYLELLKSLNLDLAGEYLVLASTLIHIKSRMLLPELPSEDDEEEDPRLELVQQLLEYQSYKDAALSLEARPQLDRDVFKRGIAVPEMQEALTEAEEPFIEASLLDLVEAFQRVIGKMKTVTGMDIEIEKISLAERILEVKACLKREKSMTFADLMAGQTSRRQLIYTFLAILELIRKRFIKAYQASSFGVIRLLYEEEGVHE